MNPKTKQKNTNPLNNIHVFNLIVNELIKYYYEPHQHDLTTDAEDFDLYEKMRTFQMDDKHRAHYKNVVTEREICYNI